MLFAIWELPFLLLLLLFGGLGIWTTACVERENFGGATFTTLIGVGLLHLFGVVNIVALFANPVLLIGCLAAYLVAGMIWSLIKWKSYLGGWRRETVDWVAEERSRYFKDNPNATEAGFQEMLGKSNRVSGKHGYYRYGGQGLQAPKVRENLGLITGWAVYWVPSLIWTVIDDPIRRAFQWLVLRLGVVFESIRQGEQNKLARDIANLPSTD